MIYMRAKQGTKRAGYSIMYNIYKPSPPNSRSSTSEHAIFTYGTTAIPQLFAVPMILRHNPSSDRPFNRSSYSVGKTHDNMISIQSSK